MTLPPLPTTLYSTYGPIPVQITEELKDVDTGEPLFGYWDCYKRVIYVRAHMHPSTLWATLFHEKTHADLCDIGVKLSTNQEEAVCNAIAAARLAEFLDTLRTP